MHILMQLLILLHYIANYAQAPNDILFKPNTQPFTLTVDQKSWIKQTTRKILDIFEKYSSLGKLYADTIILVLRRDTNWVRLMRNMRSV